MIFIYVVKLYSQFLIYNQDIEILVFKEEL